jgi:hypothetical protein
VTAELALGLLGLALAVYLLGGLFVTVMTQIRCVDAASEIARQGARGDQAAVERVSQGLPAGAVVKLEQRGDLMLARVEVSLTPWGAWFDPIRLAAEAETVREGGGG